MATISKDNQIFQNLFVLELANNHMGSLNRGINIIRDHGSVVRHNNVKASIKLQFRNVDRFIHKSYKGNKDLRYVNKTEITKLSERDLASLISEIINVSCIPMATPFDEDSVDLCKKFNLPIIKIASSDMNDWPLIERISSLKKPVIASSGGASEKDLDDLVTFFHNRSIPLAINHCVSLYPSEDDQLELNQIDYLKNRYPDNVIGFSTHEYNDWSSSMLISYAKGARTWERHIDIETDNYEVSKYCSLPYQIDEWSKSYKKVMQMSGSSSDNRRQISNSETKYLNNLVRGVYAKRNLKKGHIIKHETFEENFYLAIPLHKGQLSCREIINGEVLTNNLAKDDMLTISDIDGPYSSNDYLKKLILNRGID